MASFLGPERFLPPRKDSQEGEDEPGYVFGELRLLLEERITKNKNYEEYVKTIQTNLIELQKKVVG